MGKKILAFFGKPSLKITSSAIAEIDEGPHGTITHKIITKPEFLIFQEILKTDRPTEKVTYTDHYPSSKKYFPNL